jgi:hypothetical protein
MNILKTGTTIYKITPLKNRRKKIEIPKGINALRTTLYISNCLVGVSR